jgi:flagellar biosynthesis/type III secretory pathway protein FliH
MSALIKSGAERAFMRPLAAALTAPDHAPLSAQDEEREGLMRQIETLEEALRQREGAMAALRDDAVRQFSAGEENGRAAGLAEAQDRQAERLQLLESAITETRAELTETLASCQRLAGLLAQDCLDKILGAAADREILVERIIAEQVGKIDKAMILAVEVSQADFPASEIAALGARLGLPEQSIVMRNDLSPGACEMVLRLGRMNIGLNQQWGALRAVLDDMAAPEGSA